MCANSPIQKRKISSRTTSALRNAAKEACTGNYSDIRLPPDVQKKRVAAVLQNELTEKQKSCVLRVLSGCSIREIALQDGVCPSTISRTFHRGMSRLRRFMRY